MRVLLDTNAWAWTLSNNTLRLSQAAVDAIEAADSVFVSPIAVFEIGQKVRIGKWPEMEPYVEGIEQIFLGRGGAFAPLTPATCLAASLLDWDHRDPFDRLMAATAIELGVPLISTDTHFDSLPPRKGWQGRLW